MKFDNLEVALDLNRDEPPSLSLAFYLIQSIVKDIEKESGQKFKNADIGDENDYTGLLGNQMRTLLNTYSVTKESLKGPAGKLMAMSEKLEEADKELNEIRSAYSSLNDTEEKLDSKEKELSELKKSLSELKEKKSEYDSLCSECDLLQEKISDMKNYDIAGKKKMKEELLSEYESFGQKATGLNDMIHDLTDKLENIRSEFKKSESEKDALNSDINDTTEKKSELDKENQKLKNDLEQLKADCSGIEEDNKKIKLKYDSAVLRKEELEKEIREFSTEYDRFFSEELQPLKERNNEMKLTVNSKEKIRKDLDDEYSGLDQTYSELLTSVSKLQNTEIPALEESIKKKTNEKVSLEYEYSVVREKNEKLKDELDAIQRKISTVKKNIEDFENNIIPQAHKQYEILEKTCNERDEEYKELYSQIEETQQLISLAKKDCLKSDADLQELRNELDVLRTGHTKNNKEIEKLRARLAELRGLTDQVGFIAVKKSLNDEITEQKKLLEEKKSYEEDCRKIKKEIEDLRVIISKLEEGKSQYESDKEKLLRRRNEFEFINDPRFKDEAIKLNEKCRTISKIKKHMETSSQNIRKALEYEPFLDSYEMDERINKDLDEIEKYLDDIFKDMKQISQKFFDSLEGE